MFLNVALPTANERRWICIDRGRALYPDHHERHISPLCAAQNPETHPPVRANEFYHTCMPGRTQHAPETLCLDPGIRRTRTSMVLVGEPRSALGME